LFVSDWYLFQLMGGANVRKIVRFLRQEKARGRWQDLRERPFHLPELLQRGHLEFF
jgi:hypothetical protein